MNRSFKMFQISRRCGVMGTDGPMIARPCMGKAYFEVPTLQIHLIGYILLIYLE